MTPDILGQMDMLLKFIFVTYLASAIALQFPSAPRSLRNLSPGSSFSKDALRRITLKEVVPYPVREFLHDQVGILTYNSEEQDDSPQSQSCEDDMAELFAQLGKIFKPGATDLPATWALQS